MVFYFRLLLIFFWLSLTSLIGMLMAIPRWGDVNLDGVFSRMFYWGASRITGIRVRLEGSEHLEAHQPCIYVVNHQGAMDLLLFGNIYPRRTVVIGKKELIWIPFFGLMYVAFGNIRIDRSRRVQAIAGLAEAVEAVKKRGVSLWIFPEGTRNRTDEPMLPFKKGAFYMATQAGVPIVPVVASNLGRLVSYPERRIDPGELMVRVLPPIDPKAFASVDELLRATQEKMKAAFLSRDLLP